MKLEYQEIEDSYDETTKIRTMTEQVIVEKKGLLVPTTVDSPLQLSVHVVFIPGGEPSTL